MTLKISSKLIHVIKKIDVPLLTVIIVGIVVRYLFFISIGQNIIMVSDSWTYLNCAKMLQKTFYLDVYRPPVYPAAILFCGTFLSWEKYYIGIIFIQVIMSILSTILVYKICMFICRSRLIGLLTSLIANISISTYGWDFMLMTENFSIFFVTLLTYLVLKYSRNHKPLYFCSIFIVLLLLIYTKPFFLFMPVLVMLLLILSAKLNGFKINLTPIITGCMIIYLSVFFYSVLNYKLNGYFGLTSVSNVNCFGKILQYKMEPFGNNTEIKEDIKHAYNNTSKDNLVGGQYLEPWGFLSKYGWGHNNYKDLGDFSYSIIKANPFLFIIKSLSITGHIIFKTCPFRDFIAVNALERSHSGLEFIFILKSLTNAIELLYASIIVFFIYTALIIIYYSIQSFFNYNLFKLKRKGTINKDYLYSHMFGLLTISIIILYHYLVSSFFSYGDYSRLLAPSYYLMYLAMTLSLFYTIKPFFHIIKRISSK